MTAPGFPEPHAIAVVVLTLVAFYLFSRERLPLETTSLAVLTVLTLGFQLFPYERDGQVLDVTDFYLGFGHEALVTICALMILGRGLVTTGALEPVARLFARAWGSHPRSSLLLLLVFAAAASGVVNDTPVVVLMMPILVGVALRTGTSPTSSLLSMNYAVLIGGMSTSIGTSTNLLVVAIAADLGVRRFGIFEFTPMAALAAIGGLLYVWLVLPRLVTARATPMTDITPRVFNAVLHVLEGSFADGKDLVAVRDKTGGRLKIDRIERGEYLTLAKLPTVILAADDRLFVRDTPEDLKEFETVLGATLHNVDDPEKAIGEEQPLVAPDQQLAEVVVTENSPLDHSTLKRTYFADRYNVVVLALHRSRERGAVAQDHVAETVLRIGDVLLVQGTKQDIQGLRTGADLLVLDQTVDLPHTQKAPLALAIMALVVIAAVTKIVPISVSALVGVLRCCSRAASSGPTSAPRSAPRW